MAEWRSVEAQNLWWTNPRDFEKLDEDLVLLVQKYGNGLVRKNIKDLIIPSSIHFIKGPRRSGKTVYLKMLIKGLIENWGSETNKGENSRPVPPRSILFYSVEAKSIKEVVTKIKEFFDFNPGHQQYRIFLDEITSIKEVDGEKGWASNIKALFDAGLFKNTSLVLTGSDANLLEKGRLVLLGRGGAEKNTYLLFPLTFRDFIIGVISNGTYLSGVLTRLGAGEGQKRDMAFNAHRQLLSNLTQVPDRQDHGGNYIPLDFLARPFFRQNTAEMLASYGKFSGYLGMLHDLFMVYLNTGGFAQSISDYVIDRKEAPSILLYSNILSDVLEKLSLSDMSKDSAEKILIRIAMSQGSTISYRSISQGTGLSEPTIERYVSALESLHLLITVHDYKPGIKTHLKKIYLTDPLIFYVLKRKATNLPIETLIKETITDEIAISSIIESLIANALALSAQEAADMKPPLFFKSANSKKELDFVLLLPNDKKIGIEVKYQNEIHKSDIYRSDDFDKIILITKDTFSRLEDNVIAIPAYLFLSTIKKSDLFL